MFYEASSRLSATRSPLRTKESEDFGTQEAYEGLGEHFSGFLGCVVEEVLWMSQHIEQSLHKFLVLGRKKSRRQILRRALLKVSGRGRHTTRTLVVINARLRWE